MSELRHGEDEGVLQKRYGADYLSLTTAHCMYTNFRMVHFVLGHEKKGSWNIHGRQIKKFGSAALVCTCTQMSSCY